MWPKIYRDYKEDDPHKKCPVEPGKGIVGCEMHDLNGWGSTLHRPEVFVAAEKASSVKRSEDGEKGYH